MPSWSTNPIPRPHPASAETPSTLAATLPLAARPPPPPPPPPPPLSLEGDGGATVGVGALSSLMSSFSRAMTSSHPLASASTERKLRPLVLRFPPRLLLPLRPMLPPRSNGEKLSARPPEDAPPGEPTAAPSVALNDEEEVLVRLSGDAPPVKAARATSAVAWRARWAGDRCGDDRRLSTGSSAAAVATAI